MIEEELNVREVAIERDEGKLVILSAKANFKVLGPRFGARMRDFAEAIAGLTHDEVDDLIEGQACDVLGESVQAGDVVVHRTARPGLIVAAESQYSVALDTTLDERLRSEGIAREIINRIQALRREAGLDVSDRIAVGWHSDAVEVGAAIARHGDLIAAEVLAASMTEGGAGLGTTTDVNGLPLEVAVTPAPLIA